MDIDDASPTLTVYLLDHERPPENELRTWAQNALAGRHITFVNAVQVVLTELVANAYDHGQAPRHVKVWVAEDRSSIRTEVADFNRFELPVVGRSRHGGSRGHGMLMINSMSRDWGVDVHRLGKTVWAEVRSPILTLISDTEESA